MALTSYLLGHIYQKFGSIIAEKAIQAQEQNHKYVQSGIDTQQQARDYYKEAHVNFKKVYHLVGSYLSAVRITDLEKANNWEGQAGITD